MKSFIQFKESLHEEELFLLEFDDFEDEESLSENMIAKALAKVKAAFAGVTERIEKAKTKMNQLTQKAAEWKQKASKTEDPIAKASYDAKIQTADARMQAYTAYTQYQQALGVYRQAKAKELEIRQKGREKRGAALTRQ